MIVREFPACCTGKVMVGFGQTETAEYGIRPDGNELPVEKIKAEIGRHLNLMTGKPFLSAVTNDQQVNANQALEECGFLSSDWMSKRQHSETKVKLWWFPIENKQING